MIKLIFKAITIDQNEQTRNQFEEFQQQQLSSKRKTSWTRNAIDNSTTNSISGKKYLRFEDNCCC
jgi:hypothetical protein